MKTTNDPIKALEEMARSRIAPRTRMQCKVCHFIYDPDEGCLEWQAEPGTPFLDIPAIYDCPACGCPHSGFIILDRERGSGDE